MPTTSALPYNLAPRLISRRAAAEYASLSPNTFDKMMADGRMPRPKKLTNRRLAWDVRELDRAIDALPTDAPTAPDDETWEDVDAA